MNISSLPSELCLLQLTSLTKRFPNDPASTLLSRMELPSGRHILETARSLFLLLSAFVPSQFLAEAVLTAVSFLNRIPSSVISGLSLFERIFSTPPDYEELRVYRELPQLRLEPGVQPCRKTHPSHYSDPTPNSS